MPNYSKLIVVGHLVRDPEYKVTQSGTGLCKGTIAYNRYAGPGKEKKPVFVDFTIWSQRGEMFAQNHLKGDAVMLEGELDQENWEAKDGTKRSKLAMQVNNFVFMKNKRDGIVDVVREANTADMPADAKEVVATAIASLGGKVVVENAVPVQDDIPF